MVVRKAKTPKPVVDIPDIPSIDKQAGNAKILVIIVVILSIVLGYVFLQGQSDKITLVDNHDREMREAKNASDRELHTSQESTAIAYAQLRAQFNIAKQACDHNTQKYQAIKIWTQQHSKGSPPPDILTEEPCAAPERKDDKELIK